MKPCRFEITLTIEANHEVQGCHRRLRRRLLRVGLAVDVFRQEVVPEKLSPEAGDCSRTECDTGKLCITLLYYLQEEQPILVQDLQQDLLTIFG